MPMHCKSDRLFQFPCIAIDRREIPIPADHELSVHIPVIQSPQKIGELVIKSF